MNDTQPHTQPRAVPRDPAMAASDPDMFTPLSTTENSILSDHLRSGWAKQGAVYAVLSEPWKETAVTLNDLHSAWKANFQAEHPAKHPAAFQAEHEPEAGQ